MGFELFLKGLITELKAVPFVFGHHGQGLCDGNYPGGLLFVGAVLGDGGGLGVCPSVVDATGLGFGAYPDLCFPLGFLQCLFEGDAGGVLGDFR